MANYDVFIIGGGPAGIAAAIWCKRLEISHLLIEAHSDVGGQLVDIVPQIIDYPGSLLANGMELQRKLSHHLQELECDYVLNTRVQEIDPVHKKITLQDQNGDTTYQYKNIIFATGASKRRLGIPGELEMIARGEEYSIWKDGKHFAGKQVLVVGGGDEAFEGAVYLADSGAYVNLIHRSETFRARADFVAAAVAHPRVNIITNCQVREILGKDNVTGVITRDHQGNEVQLPANAVFIRIGISPNSSLLKNVAKMDTDGYIVTDAHGRTSEPNIYAIGDVCNKPQYSSIANGMGQAMVTAKHIMLSSIRPKK